MIDLDTSPPPSSILQGVQRKGECNLSFKGRRSRQFTIPFTPPRYVECFRKRHVDGYTSRSDEFDRSSTDHSDSRDFDRTSRDCSSTDCNHSVIHSSRSNSTHEYDHQQCTCTPFSRRECVPRFGAGGGTKGDDTSLQPCHILRNSGNTSRVNSPGASGWTGISNECTVGGNCQYDRVDVLASQGIQRLVPERDQESKDGPHVHVTGIGKHGDKEWVGEREGDSRQPLPVFVCWCSRMFGGRTKNVYVWCCTINIIGHG